MQMKWLVGAALLLTCVSPALADDDIANLKKQGYTDWKQTKVKGEFKGCKVGQMIRFENGLTFKCSESESAEKMTTGKSGEKVVILKHKPSGFYKTFIDGEKLEGQLSGMK